MKHLPIAFLAAMLPALAAAQGPADTTAAERGRIAAERSRLEAEYHARERACWGQFAVNDCLSDARAQRRSALADLRRQEISLNDAQRKQRGAERVRAIEQRSAGPVPAPAASAPRLRNEQGQRDAKAAQRAAGQAARAAEHSARATPGPLAHRRAGRVKDEMARREEERSRRAEQAARNAERRQALQQEAKERQEALQRRLAARHKPPARPLPVPP